ncbi:MAG: PspC domain-containing protein, partial [Nocardioides sp.]|nr:PspC domain-containing protein [Nocardioides sp.]
PQTGPRRLVRNTHEGMLGGVCAGLADYSGIDRNLIRVLVVIGSVLGLGSLIIAYIAAWLLMPAR